MDSVADTSDAITKPQKPVALQVNASSIPKELKELSAWVIWDYRWNAKDGKYTKPPLDYRTGNPFPRNSIYLPTTTHATFAEAHMAACELDYAGVGLLILKGNGFGAIDLDDCVDADGAIEPYAQELIEQFATYTELSPSGRGVRMIFKLPPEGGVSTQKLRKRHIYNDRHYVTITGDVIGAYPVTELEQLELERVAMAWGVDLDSKTRADGCDLAVIPPGEPYTREELLAMGMGVGEVDTLFSDPGAGGRSKLLFNLVRAVAVRGGDNPGRLHGLAVECDLGAGALAGRTSADWMWRYTVGPALVWAGREKSRVAGEFGAEAWDADLVDGLAPTAVGGAGATETHPPNPSKFKLMDLAAFSADFRSANYFIKGLLPRGQIGMIWGPSGAGKTFVLFDLLFAISGGGGVWNGHRAVQSKVVYLCGEGHHGVKKRIRAYADRAGMSEAELDALPFKIVDGAPDLYSGEGDTLAVIEACRSSGLQGCDLLVIDTLAQASAGADENSSELSVVIKRCQVIARKLNCMVLLVHHAGKDVDRGSRGWSGLKGPLDIEILVNRPEAERDGRTMKVTKNKDGEDGVEYDFHLDPVKFTDDEGDPMTSCVVIWDSTLDSTGRVVPTAASQFNDGDHPTMPEGKEGEVLTVIATMLANGEGNVEDNSVDVGDLIEKLDELWTADGKARSKESLKATRNRAFRDLGEKYLLSRQGKKRVRLTELSSQIVTESAEKTEHLDFDYDDDID